MIPVISVVFISPLFVAGDLHNFIRTGKILFFAKWMLLIITVGLFVFIRNRKLFDKEIKVPSKAIEEIREAMRKIITINDTPDGTTGENKEKGENYIKISSILIKQQFW